MNNNHPRRMTAYFTLVLGFALWAGLSMAGRSVHVGQRDFHHIDLRYLDDSAISISGFTGNVGFIGPCTTATSFGDSAVANTGSRAYCIPDPGLNGYRLTGIGITISENLTGNVATSLENCLLTLMTSDTTAGTLVGISSSNIVIGPNLNNTTGSNNITSRCGTNVMQNVGDTCMIGLDTSDPNSWIEPGGRYTLRASQGHQGTCDRVQGAHLRVDGVFP